MKSNTLKIALEGLKGSVSSELDCVEITGPTLRVSDGMWWAETTPSGSISTPMTLPYSKLRSIVRTLDEEDEIELEPNGSACRVKAPATLWQLNLLNVSTEPPPPFPTINTIEASGYALLEAYKSLKHLIRTDLSKIGLMWAWTNDDHQLVIGDGARLGGHQTGIKDLELPLIILSEISRILAVHLSEKVILHLGEKHIRATMRDVTFQAILPAGPQFEVDWYNKVRNLLDENPQVIKMSRSDLLRAINQVRITAGEDTLKLAPGNKGLTLMTKDEHGNKSTSEIETSGNLKEPISLNIDHLSQATEALTNELLVMKVCGSVIEVSDKKRWEIIMNR